MNTLLNAPLVTRTKTSIPPRFIKWFEDVDMADLNLVGGKNAALGELCRNLVPLGIKVPRGFAVTADGYRLVMATGGLQDRVDAVLRDLHTQDTRDLQARGRTVRQLILASPLPAELECEIQNAYLELSKGMEHPADVAVRSSATAEDLPDASFAGQQETYLNVQGVSALLDSCRHCFASLFTDRAISYRADQGFDHLKVALSIGVQRMVRSDLAASGVMFTLDTDSGFPDVILINGAYGLGENVVQGSVNPDEYVVHKPTLKKGFRPVLRMTLGSKEFKLVYDTGGNKMVKNVPVSVAERQSFALSEDEILTLARWGNLIEEHYSRKRGQATPMDIEWAKDGLTDDLFIVQARPETVQSQRDRGTFEAFTLKNRGKILVTGRSVGDRIARGAVRVVRDARFLSEIREGEILVAERTDPDWEPVMKKAAAIVTTRGGRTCHAAIVSRELGVPAIVGAEKATTILDDGQEVTISCAEGETGFVYDGLLDFEVTRTSVRDLARPNTKVMLNVANPEAAFSQSFLPNDGVGLARMEFIISNFIKVHPLALIHFDRLEDVGAIGDIERLTVGYADKAQFFVDRLASGIGTIAAAFYPKDVIVRLSDFKTNEYANLLGGRTFEPHEENPMLGFRGASRYYHPRYQEGFALECRALKKVREDMGLTNLKVMVPFCRTVEEGVLVQRQMEQHGLKRGENGLEIYVMCEIPSNVILAEQFAEIFDGFSIGSNDLTQLVLGVDRDSEIVAPIFDERNPAVKQMIAKVISVCRERGKKIGICGQAPSDYPDFAQFLVGLGIDSISLNPDSVLKTTRAILDAEAALSADQAEALSKASAEYPL